MSTDPDADSTLSEYHPRLPGRDLDSFEFANGEDVCLYDSERREAYIIGRGIEVGVER